MASIADIKSIIDMESLAERLGMKRAKGAEGGKSMWHSPTHKDNTPSLSMTKQNGIWLFKDWSDPDAAHSKGSVVDLVIYAGKATDTGEALRLLHEWFGVAFDKPDQPREKVERSLADHIADQCWIDTQPAIEYLKSRGITDLALAGALKHKSIGWNNYSSKKVPAGQHGHGGPAAAFIVRTLNPGRVVAVDLRYLDAEANGGTKTQCHGEKSGYGWTSDIKRLLGARTIYITESPINALSVESAFPTERHTAAFAVRGIGNIENIDFSWARGKQIRICLDHRDKVNERTGYRAGLKAAWDLHERLTMRDISALLVDQSGWDEGDDLNDVLQKEGSDGLIRVLKNTEQWLIPGLAGKDDSHGKRRIYLPSQDFGKYWLYRVKDDHTQIVTKCTDDPDNEDAPPRIEMGDLCGFRVASLARVTIQSAQATMTGDVDAQPDVQFSVSVQTPRHGAKLVRKVFHDEDLHNIAKWEKFGPIYSPAGFKRMVNILERTAEIGARKAVNFVGLAWKDGQLEVNEGIDTYFTEPEKQCPYHNLTFPRGTTADARQVIEAFGATMKQNAATMLLIWSLGGHLKLFLDFWPHMELQADKGAGKSTLIKKLERAIAFTMFSNQSIKTEYRLITSVAHTTHPVGWEEISANAQFVIDAAAGLLQQTYQSTVTRRGSDMTEYLLCAPVLLVGEDVPVKTLAGKLINVDITGKKGAPIPDTSPRFPVHQWLQFLASLNKARVLECFEDAKSFCTEGAMSNADDSGAERMIFNYAGMLTAWNLLAEFAGLPDTWNNVPGTMLTDMNRHISATTATRHPWVWIMDIILSEISKGSFQHPFKWESVRHKDTHQEEFCLCIRAGHIMDHIAHSPALREKWNALPVKSDRVFKKQIIAAGVVHVDDFDTTRGSTRLTHYMAVSKSGLERFGLHATYHFD